MIVGGSPCTGFSVTGHHQGVENEGSGLVNEMIRLIGECKPKFVFIENVPTIVTFQEFPTICEQIGRLGYRLVWTVLPASDLGAPHRRKRWWALCTRNDIQPGDVTIKLKSECNLVYDWSEEPVDRCIHVQQGTLHRLFTLGNTLVPCVARVAFLALFTGLRMPFSSVISSTAWTNADVASTAIRQGGQQKVHHGRWTEESGVVRIMPPRNDMQLERPREYTFDASLYQPANIKRQNKHPLLTDVVHMKFFATPRTLLMGSVSMTRRTIWDLPTQFRFEKNTTGPRDGVANPCFVEWMMGYPIDWTSAQFSDS